MEPNEETKKPSRNRVTTTLFLVIVLLLGLGLLVIYQPLRLDHWYRKAFGVAEGVRVGGIAVGGKLPEEVRKILLKEAEFTLRWPVAATIDKSGVVNPEVRGLILDVEATLKEVLVASPYAEIIPVYADICPTVTAKELWSLTRPKGSYCTIIEGTEARLTNIKLAAQLVDYTVLLPLEVFSFNRTVGQPTVERGFQKAPVIIKEELVPGVGGGICQVSTTLYNAVLAANLQVVERFSHSKQVTYVPSGQDATVAYDYMDFKFRNTSNSLLLIRLWVWGRRLEVTIFGPAL